MRTEVWASLGDRGGAWDSLVEKMDLPSPFLRSWWVDGATEGSPVIVAVSEGDGLLGGLALQHSTLFGVETLKVAGGGALEPDHLDVVAAPADRGRVTDAVCDWLGRRGSRVIDLDGVAASSLLVERVRGVGEVTVRAVAPYVELPNDASDYLAGRPGRVRSTITRTSKRLDRDGIRFERVDAGGMVTALDDLERLHGTRWGGASGVAGAWESLRRAAVAGAESGDVWLSRLVTAEGVTIAAEIEFVVAGRASFYQAGRLTDHEYRGSGSVLRHRIVNEAIASGCTEFDLLRGDEPYKAEWADRGRELVRIRRGVGPRGAAVVVAARVNAAVAARRAAREDGTRPTS